MIAGGSSEHSANRTAGMARLRDCSSSRRQSAVQPLLARKASRVLSRILRTPFNRRPRLSSMIKVCHRRRSRLASTGRLRSFHTK